MKYSSVRILNLLFAITAISGIAAVTAFAQNLDPDSFGNNVKFAGEYAAGAVVLDPSPTATPPPGGETLIHLDPQPANTNFDVQDIGSFVIPKKTAKTIVYFIPVLQYSYSLHNDTGAAASGLISFDIYYTLENAALNDPSVIDPATGMPANGKLVNLDFAFAFRKGHTLQPGEGDLQTLYYSRASLAGMDRSFFSSRGIPNHVIDKIYKNDTTFRVHMRGSATLVSSASAALVLRAFSD
jgi:hypothetical protein